MKKLLLLFVVIFTYAYADEESVELTSSEEESVRELVTLVETKLNSTIFSDILVLINKTESRCPGIEEKLDKAVEEVGECLDDIDLDEDTFCTVIRKSLEKCSKPFTKILVDCLPEESKGLPILGVKILKAVLDQACNSTVEEILELFNPCALKKEFDSFDTCSSLKTTFTQYRDKVPSKSLVCSCNRNYQRKRNIYIYIRAAEVVYYTIRFVLRKLYTFFILSFLYFLYTVKCFKMNKFVLILLFTAACVHAEGESSSSSEEDLKSLAKTLEDKLNLTLLSDFIVLSERAKKQCPDLEQTLDTTVEEVGNCIENIELGDNTFCSLLRHNLEKCSEPVKKALVGCLPEESKGLPVMVIKIVKAVIDQACNSTVEEILELFNPCTRAKDFQSYETCTKVRNVLIEYKNKVPSKSLVCSVLPNIKSCIKSHQEASCKNPVTKSAMVNFYEAIDEATATECQDLNKTK